MKFLSELRTMIDDMTEKQDTRFGGEDKPISISGDNNVIVVYAAGPVTIYGSGRRATGPLESADQPAPGKRP